MLHRKVDSESYRSEFRAKFENFINKAPILASMIITPENVQVIHVNTQKKYTYEWDFSKHVKTFIHEIKQDLLFHYPRLLQVVTEEKKLTPEEQAHLIESGEYEPSNVPSTILEKKKILWRIDKVIVVKDIFILVREDTQQTFRYKMNKSCVYFLKSYRNGHFKSLEEAAEYFFSKSELLNEILLKSNHETEQE